MLDGILKPHIDPLMTRAGKSLVKLGFSADLVTIGGLVLGLVAAGLIVLELYFLGLVFLLVSRIFDGLDGAVARLTKPTDFGGYLDITLDFVFYGAIPLAFVLANPSQNAVAGAVLIFTFYINGASFLASAIMAEKHKLTTNQRGEKSFFFTTGLAEATETIVVFSVFCLLPQWFAPIAYVFAAICAYTALARIVETRAMLR